jgi:O-methyltransferase
MKLFLVRYSKIVFTYLRLHLFFNIFASLYINLFYLTKFSLWVNRNRKIGYNDFPSKWDYSKRYKMYGWVLEKENIKQAPVNYLEFGVADGFSFKWFLKQNTHPDSRFYGFDTFTGLPEDFGVYKKGMFSSEHGMPEISDQRGKFYQGLFQQTLPGFLKEYLKTDSRRKVIMMDADLYSATLFVLTSIAPFLQKGDIIFFDEFAVPVHEFKAYDDFIKSYYVNLELIAAANNYYFSAFKVV